MTQGGQNHPEKTRDLLVREALADEGEHLSLARGENVRVRRPSALAHGRTSIASKQVNYTSLDNWRLFGIILALTK